MGAIVTHYTEWIAEGFISYRTGIEQYDSSLKLALVKYTLLYDTNAY